MDYYYYYYYYYGSTALCWALAAFSVSWSCTQSVEFSGTGDQLVTRHLPTHRTNVHNTDINASSGIRIYHPSIQASEDSSCLRSARLNRMLFVSKLKDAYKAWFWNDAVGRICGPITLIQYSDIGLKRQNKTMRITSQDNRPPDRSLNPWSPEYETGILFIASWLLKWNVE
jgi:hypothetical protein